MSMDALIAQFNRVLARISKMPAQNSNSKISDRPCITTQLLQILTPTTLYRLLCQKGQLTIPPHPRTWFSEI